MIPFMKENVRLVLTSDNLQVDITTWTFFYPLKTSRYKKGITYFEKELYYLLLQLKGAHFHSEGSSESIFCKFTVYL